jgi:magnesium-transporting ATPase (P-type)
MTAFLTVLLAGGWSYGGPVSAGTVATASGAAFTAIVLGQFATAFACRSATRPPWRLGWRSNRLLVWAVGVELAVLVALLVVPTIADLLGHRPPSPAGLLVAGTAVPLVLAADAGVKRLGARRRGVRG